MYKIIDILTSGDEYESGNFNSENEAIKECQVQWDCLSDYDKNRRRAFQVGYFEDENDVDYDIVYDAIARG